MAAAEIGVLRMGEHVFKPDPQHVDEHYKQVAEKELRETPEVRDAALAKLKELIKDVDGFKFPLDSDEADAILLRFLRPCKFYPESALEKMKKFFAFKYNQPSIAQNLLCEEDRKVFNKNLIRIVPARDQHRRRIVIIETGKKWVPKEVSLTNCIRGLVIGLDTVLISPSNQIVGGVLIINCDGMSLTHLWQVTPNIALTILQYVQDCVPLRLKAVHIVNQGHIFKLVFAIFKPFLNPKLRNRIHFHGKDWESLRKHIDAEALPKEFGGELEMTELPENQVYDFLVSYKKYHEEIAAVGYTRKPNL